MSTIHLNKYKRNLHFISSSYSLFCLQLKEIREKFKGNTGDIDTKAKDLLDRFTGKGREVYRKFLEKIGINTSEDAEYAEG